MHSIQNASWNVCALVVSMLAACGDRERVPETALPIADGPTAVAPPAIDLASLIPKQPGAFGPWAKVPLGARWEEVSRATPQLIDGTLGRSSLDKTLRYEVGADGKRLPSNDTLPRFGGVNVSSHLQAYTIDLDRTGLAAVEVAWGPPTSVVDPRGKPRKVWWAKELRIEKTDVDGATRLVFTQALPLSAFVGGRGLAFERSRSLVGLTAKDAIAQIESWAGTLQYSVWSRSDLDDTAAAFGRVTGKPISPDRVMVVGKDGEVTPLSETGSSTVSVYLPPNDQNYESLEYRNTVLILRLEHGTVRSYRLTFWIADAASYDAAIALFSKIYGKPKASGDQLRYPVKPVACLDAKPRAYAGIDVGECK